MFTGNSGGHGPNGVTSSGGTLFGTTEGGGLWGFGTVFAINADGTGFRILHDFTDATWNRTNQDGALPTVGVIMSANNTLYGTTTSGGTFGSGTVFALNTDGSGFRVLHSFAAISGGVVDGPYGDIFTNSDGAGAVGLIQSGNTLYGTTLTGGDSANGTVFSITLSTNPPQPNITATGGNIILTWPTNYAGFDYSEYRLQTTRTLPRQFGPRISRRPSSSTARTP